MKYLLLGVWSLTLVGCSLLGSSEREVRRYYAVSHPASCDLSSVRRQTVVRVSGPSFYDTQRIVFSRADGERQYYNYSLYTERPFEFLERSLDRKEGRDVNGGPAMVDLFVESLFHDARSEPGFFVIRGTVQAASLPRVSFDMSEPVEKFSAEGAVQAFERILCPLTKFVDEYLDQHQEAASSNDPNF